MGSLTEDAGLQQLLTIRFQKIRAQLETCHRSHGRTCSMDGVSAGDSAKIILIDVQAMCLVQATTEEKYFTLSYVWGGIEQFHPTKATIAELMENGALSSHHDKIPTLIMECMELVRRLKAKYLWVDALCIIEDDASHKHDQISQMAAIYSSSFLTIVTTDARDAMSHLSILQRFPSKDPRHKPLRSWSQCQQLVKRLLESNYGSRGWTFQERLLSRRLLYAFTDQVLLQCPSGLWLMDAVSRWQKLQGHSTTFKKLSPLFGSATSPWSTTTAGHHYSRSTALNTYSSLATEYMTKRLTYDSDILYAFSGIMGGLTKLYGLKFIYGLPEKFLHHALLWRPSGLVNRRRSDLQIPSWSWMSCTGPVNFCYGQISSSGWSSMIELLPCIGHIEIWDQFEKRPIAAPDSRGWMKSHAPGLKSYSPSAEPEHVELPSWSETGVDAILHFGACCIPFNRSFTYRNASFVRCSDTWDFSVPGKSDRRGIELLSLQGQSCGWLMGLTSQILDIYIARTSTLDLVLLSECRYWTAYVAFGTKQNGFDETFSEIRGFGFLNVMLIEWDNGRAERLAIGQVAVELWNTCESSQKDIYLI